MSKGVLSASVVAIVVMTVGAGATAASGYQTGTVRVTSSADAGPGSFRTAVAKANADASIGRVELRPGLGPIELTEPVVYTGAQELDVAGNGGVVDGAGLQIDATAAFLANGGGNLNVTWLTVQNAPQQGLAYEVPSAASGVKKVVLVGVRVVGNDGHGVLINDQAAADDTANPDGSDASLEVSVLASRFAENGFGALDRDGIRINEGGNGNLTAGLRLSRWEHNGADGIELDERGSGDASFTVSGVQISRNGSFDVTEADLDDGMDVDESGEGALRGTVAASTANDNFEEGWDFNENDAGDFDVDMVLVEASGNLEEGIDFEEDDDVQGGGDLRTTLTGVKTNGNGPGGDAGLKIRERGDGMVSAVVRGVQAQDNLSGGINVREQGAGDLQTSIERATATENGLAGISVREDDAGNLGATVDRSTTDANAGHGIDVDENSAGDLTATVSRGSSSSNGASGVRADQQAPGLGTLDLLTMTLTGNTGGPFVANAGVTVTQIP